MCSGNRRENDFSVVGAKTERLTTGLEKLNLVKKDQGNQIQSITLCIFSKKVYAVYNGVWGKASEAGEFSRIFVLKVTSQFVGYF